MSDHPVMYTVSTPARANPDQYNMESKLKIDSSVVQKELAITFITEGEGDDIVS